MLESTEPDLADLPDPPPGECPGDYATEPELAAFRCLMCKKEHPSRYKAEACFYGHSLRDDGLHRRYLDAASQ